MNKLLALLLFLVTVPALCQERSTLQGKVMVDDALLTGAFVINKQAGTEVKTDDKGLFSIAAKAGDKLVVYSDKTLVREFLITADSFKNPPYVLSVVARGYDVEEVVVESKTVTTESLGLAPPNQKRLTVAERRLAAADSGPVDILLNWLSGRKKMLERELKTERKEMAMESINGILNEDEIAAEYNIPSEQVAAFLFYVVEDTRMVNALKEGNDQLVKMLMIELAPKFLEYQKQAETPAPATPVQTPKPNEN